jgi:hypothetical protein
VGYDVLRLSPGAADAAIGWWASHLNEMFEILTNPGLYTDSIGSYQVIMQVQALATVEQLSIAARRRLPDCSLATHASEVPDRIILAMRSTNSVTLTMMSGA